MAFQWRADTLRRDLPAREVAMRWSDYKGKSNTQILFSGVFSSKKLRGRFFCAYMLAL